MPRLFRLVSNSDNSLFNNTFRETIEIKPKSKVALHNLSAEIEKHSININNYNDDLTFNVGNIDKTIYLDHSTYDKDNIDILFDDMENKLNSALTTTNEFEIGKQWEIYQQDGKTNINCLQSKYYDHRNDMLDEYVDIGTSNDDYYERDGGTLGTPDSYFFLNKPICKGSGVCRIRINKITPLKGFFYFGLTTRDLRSETLVNINKINYGVALTSGTNYSYIENGVETPTGITYNIYGDEDPTNDAFSIEIDEGVIKIIVDRTLAGNPNQLLFETDYNGEDLYPVCVFLGHVSGAKDDISFNRFRFTAETSTITTGLTYTEPDTRPVNQSFEFGSSLLSEYLGYKYSSYNFSNIIDLRLEGEKSFKALDISESYIVELLNIPLESFDGSIKQRRNILNTVVNTTENNDRIIYHSDYPLYIDINNATPILLNNIQARILKEDGSELNISHFAQMTILIDN